MPFIDTNFPDLVLYDPQVYTDQRGTFFQSYHEEIFLSAGIVNNFIQDNEAYSHEGIIRGLHYQLPPFAQAKLVRVICGEVLDVVVDIRDGSPTYGQHFKVKLSGENKLQLYVPKGFAHGYLALKEGTIFSYKCDNYYRKESEGGIKFNDPSLGIDWNVDPALVRISEKDSQLPTFGQHKPFHL